MNSILLDTNALVYWLHGGSPFHNDVARLMRKGMEQGVRFYVLASSLNDAYYVLKRHYLSEPDARASIEDAASLFELVSLDKPLVLDAIHSDEPDYEDGLVRAAAETQGIDAIVTYDEKAFVNSEVAKLTAEEATTVLTAEK